MLGKKNFPKILISALVLILSTNVVFAYSLNKPVGGKIIHTKALEISALEAANYECLVPGESITIYPVGSYPTSYLIPIGINSKTRNSIRSGQYILGLYATSMPITCVFRGHPPVTTIVNLNTITLYGTSK